jgi:hypothetical protein
MQVTMIRSTVHAEKVGEAKAAAEKVFAAIAEAQPDGVRYASTLLEDGETFVVLLALEDPERNPLPSVPGFAEFQQAIPSWQAGPPTIEQLEVVGSYQLF